MVKWQAGKDYPDTASLAQLFENQKQERLSAMTRYCIAAVILCAALFFASREPLTIVGGTAAVAIICLWTWLQLKSRHKLASTILGGDFTWAVGKVQGRWKQQVFDLGSGPRYQVGICDEWVACDMTTYSRAEIGKYAVLVRRGDEAAGICIGKEGHCKQVKRLARAASR